MLRNNLVLKIFSVLFAVILWNYVMAVENPKSQKIITNIPLRFVNEDMLAEEGLVIRGDRAEILRDIDAVVSIDRSNYRNLTNNLVRATIDVSNVKTTGEFDLPVNVTSLLGEVVSKSVTSVHLEVDDLVSKLISVVPEITGELPEGYWMSTPQITPLSIDVSGPRKDIERLRQAVVVIERNTLTRSYNDSLALHLRDESGEDMDISRFDAKQSAIVKMDVLPIKTVPIDQYSALINADQIETGYEIVSVRAFPDTSDIAAESELLSKIEKLELESVNLQNANASVFSKVKVIRPEGVTLIGKEEVELNIDIREILLTASFNDLPVEITGIERGFSAAIVPTGMISVEVTSGISKVKGLTRGSIKPYVDITGLSVGEYALEVKTQLMELLPADAQIKFTPETVNIIITES